MKTSLFSLFALSCLFSVLSLQAARNEKPFVIPELKQWSGEGGRFTLTARSRIVVSTKDCEKLLPVAQQFATDLHTMFGLTVQAGEGSKGDILLEIAPCGTGNEEGYSIAIGSRIVVKANAPVGAYWATRTLLQMLEQNGGKSLSRGKIVDYPDYAYRGFMIDAGRKYVRLPFLQDYVQFMAYYKMNVFHIHLSDNGFKQFFGNDWMATPAAFRLESDTYPGLASREGYYTKQQFIDLQKLAEAHFVTIIPEIDIPAHSLAFSQYRPSLGSREYGMDHLDLSNPDTYTFFDALFKEYLSGDNPVFRGRRVHIGTDEYSNHDSRVVEQFRAFTDHYIREVEKYGKQAMVWGALTHAKGTTPVKSENVLMECWYNGYANPKEMMEQGYDVVSIPDGLVYIVPAAGYYYDYLNCRNLYENWTPAVIGDQKFEEDNPHIKGGEFAVWNDHCRNGITDKDIHDRVWPAMQTMAQKMWGGSHVTLSFDSFDKQRNQLSEAPGIDIKGRVKGVKGVVYQKDTLRAGATNTMVEVGYPYRVEFTLNARGNLNGTWLFGSPNGTLWLRDLKSGRLAFEREGYLDTFDYEVPDGQAVSIAIEGDNRSVTLFVDGQLKQRLEQHPLYYSADHKTAMDYVPTFFFPLQQTGNFKGTITALKVIQK